MACELIDGDILESLKRDLERTERHARGLPAAIAGYEAVIKGPPPQQPEGVPESHRWLRGNGKPIRLIDAIETLLQEHQGEMPTNSRSGLLDCGHN
jgi:hypothetical protein